LAKSFGNDPACREKVRDDAIVDIEIAFIFAKIAKIMAFREHSPHLGP